MNTELKELDEAMSSLWYQAEISDKAKLYWNDLITRLNERESKSNENSK